MAGCCNFARIALVLTIAALFLLCFAVFHVHWWESKTFGLHSPFTTVNCDGQGMCRIEGSTNEGWVILSQVLGVTSIILIILSIISQLTSMKKQRNEAYSVSLAALIVTIAMTLLDTFVLGSVYSQLNDGHNAPMTSRPWTVLKYRTLPLGLVAIGSSLCVPAVVCLVIHWLKMKKEERKANNQSKNRVV